MDTCKSGRVSGFVVGAFGEVSTQVCDLADLVLCVHNAEHLPPFDIGKNESKGTFTQLNRRSIGLVVHRRWAKLLLGRFRDIAEDPRQPRSRTREVDKVGVEAPECTSFMF